AKEATMDQRLPEKAYGTVLQRLVEIDQHVPAGDEVNLGEDAVGREAVVREDHLRLQRRVHDGAVVGSRIVVRKRAGATRGQVVAAEGRDAIEGIDALRGDLQRRGIDVGAVEERARQQALLLEQDGERPQLLAGA